MTDDRRPTNGGGRERADCGRRRAEMVRAIRKRGVTDRRVLDVMARVPRHRFVDPDLADAAYDDHPLPIGEGQTISQPYVVALMAEAAQIRPGDVVAEVGTGSGYGAAVLGLLAGDVRTIERHDELAAAAAARLRELEVDNVTVVVGDGSRGLVGHGPFDAIVVTAAPERVPPALVEQLVDGGRLVIPVGRSGGVQHLYRFTIANGRPVAEDLGGVRFVPLVAGPVRGDHDRAARRSDRLGDV